MFVANEIDILMNRLKHLKVTNIKEEYNFPPIVEIAIPIELTTEFVDLLVMFDKKISKDMAGEKFHKELKKFLNVEHIEYE